MSSEPPTPEEIDTAAMTQSPARGMPASFYTSPEVFAQERGQIFLKHWFFAGREDELPNPGDYRAIDTVGGPVLLIRGEDDFCAPLPIAAGTAARSCSRARATAAASSAPATPGAT